MTEWAKCGTIRYSPRKGYTIKNLTTTHSTSTLIRFRADETVNSDARLDDVIRQAAAELGGAWSYAVTFGMTDLIRADSPSKIPGSYLATSRDRIFFNGQWQTFTPAVKLHEQNVGLGRG